MSIAADHGNMFYQSKRYLDNEKNIRNTKTNSKENETSV